MIPYVLEFVTFLLVVRIFCNYFAWKWRHYELSMKLPGPLALPIVGNGWIFTGNPDDFLLKIVNIIRKYNHSPIRFWLGHHLLIVFTDPKHVEKILISTKITDKYDVYDFLKPFAGEGLISGSGPKWKLARKHIQPLYGAKFVADSIGISNKHINRCMAKLHEKVDQPTFCPFDIIHLCIADIIGESILGVEIGAQRGKNKDFIDATKGMYDVVYPRIVKPWLHLDVIFNMTELKKKQDAYIKCIQGFLNKVAANAKQKKENGSYVLIDNFKSSINDLDKIFNENGPVLDNKDYIDNLLTLYAASEDTVTQIATAACHCFGMYPDCQEKAAEEIKNVIGINTTNITYEDVTKLQYLDMCVKETLRLYPIAPFIIRKVNEDFAIDKWILPPGVAALVSIFSLHLNPDEWEKPMEFYPEHFLPRQVEKRHPYSYLPFSAGPRGCIGKLFAQVSIKVILINILQRYNIHADGTYEDAYKQFRADISVRSRVGYPIRLTRRKWQK